MNTPMISVVTVAVLLGLLSTALAPDPFGLRAYHYGVPHSAHVLVRPQIERLDVPRSRSAELVLFAQMEPPE